VALKPVSFDFGEGCSLFCDELAQTRSCVRRCQMYGMCAVKFDVKLDGTETRIMRLMFAFTLSPS